MGDPMIGINALGRGELVLTCSGCAWTYGVTTHHRDLELATAITRGLDHLGKNHKIDEIRGENATTKIERGR